MHDDENKNEISEPLMDDYKKTDTPETKKDYDPDQMIDCPDCFTDE